MKFTVEFKILLTYKSVLGLDHAASAQCPFSLYLPRLSSPSQTVAADGRQHQVGFCSRFLPVKGRFFLATVANNNGLLSVEPCDTFLTV